ncbi:MAG: biliverdin-producing heme oxygenase [Rhodospirillaceae bacterium]
MNNELQSVIDAVRTATAIDHKRTEESFAVALSRLPSSYGAYLRIHAAAFPAVGRALSAELDWSPWQDRWNDLQDDLRSLGLQAPTAHDVARAASPAEALGMVYVLEGSRMGSAIILKSIPDALPAAYLRGAINVEPWRRLREMLTQADPRESRGVIAGARAAFAAFREAALAHGSAT